METAPILFSDLKAGRSAQHVVGRLLRFWEARNVKQNGQLMGVDMLLLDEKSTLMHGSISVHRLNTFKHLLHEGTMYAIGGFDVTRSSNHFKLCASNISIRFTEMTKFVEVPETICQIPTEMFTFRNHDQLAALANTNLELPDIIGEIIMFKPTINDQTQITERTMTQIRLDNGATVCLSAFDGLATQLHHKMQRAPSLPRVIIATNINPKFVGGRLFLNATSGTHFYFDDEVEASTTYNKNLRDPEKADSNTLSKYRHVQKLEPITVAELNEYIMKYAPQDVEFLCTTKVTGIQSQNGWHYIACSRCSKKLIKGTSSLTCTVCHNSNAVGVVRYRVEFIVSDYNDSAVFVAFDTDVAKLTNVRAADVGEIQNDVPQFITDIMDKTYIFQIKLTPFNFTSKHKSFTISRIFEAPSSAPNPTFANHVEDNKPPETTAVSETTQAKNPTAPGHLATGVDFKTAPAKKPTAIEDQKTKKARKD